MFALKELNRLFSPPQISKRLVQKVDIFSFVVIFKRLSFYRFIFLLLFSEILQTMPPSGTSYVT